MSKSTENTAIKVSNLSKVYQKKNTQGEMEDFYALKDVSFEVKKGEVLGIVGKNGSGKSTLLKILSGVTRPSAGEIEINGTVASILDVGTGFHPDLSGRENVYLKGELLGMNRNEIDTFFKDIVDFSEIEDFIETPVKHYSSGMFLRLAFSIIIHLKCDVLLLDEVMAVGDIGFREKMQSKIRKIVRNNNKTVLIVSHDIKNLSKHTNSILLFDNMKDNVLFLDINTASSILIGDDSTIVNNPNIYRNIKIADVAINYTTDSNLVITFNVQIIKKIDFNLGLVFLLRDSFQNNLIIYGNTMEDSKAYLLGNVDVGIHQYQYSVKGGFFLKGTYFVDLFLVRNKKEVLAHYRNCASITINNGTFFYDGLASIDKPIINPEISFNYSEIKS